MSIEHQGMNDPIVEDAKGAPHALESPSIDDSNVDSHAERRLPFVLRVATIWTAPEELRAPDDGQLRFWQRAPLTGNLTLTAHGRDISFSDMEVG